MRRATASLTLAACIGLGLLLFSAPSAFAGKGGGGGGGGGKPGGGGGGSSSFTLVLLDSTDGVPHWNQHVRFNVSTTQTTKPYVSVECRQAGTVVYNASTGYFDGYPWPWTQTFTLSSGAWTGGDADCSARLYSASNSGATTTLSTMAFHVFA